MHKQLGGVLPIVQTPFLVADHAGWQWLEVDFTRSDIP